nr:MAG TPA: Hemolysin [Caudoviricetes sp.]
MSDTIIVGLFSLCGTVFGTVGGIIASSKLTVYRIKQLENKVDKHNNFAERIPVIENNIKVANHRIEDLERRVEHIED